MTKLTTLNRLDEIHNLIHKLQEWILRPKGLFIQIMKYELKQGIFTNKVALELWCI